MTLPDVVYVISRKVDGEETGELWGPDGWVRPEDLGGAAKEVTLYESVDEARAACWDRKFTRDDAEIVAFEKKAKT